MESKVLLRGITWDHSRGYTPLIAASQRYGELHPHLSITWEKRSLQAFEDMPLDKLAQQYDMLIIDHPWIGSAASSGLLAPLDKYLRKEVLQDCAAHAVGASHESYRYRGNQWALAIDAAAPVASYRKDLLDRYGIAVPLLWEDVIALAKSGKVAVPSIPIYLLMYFYGFCVAHGEKPFQTKEEIISEPVGIAALEGMQSLWKVMDKCVFSMNPIHVAEYMAQSDTYWYCPFSYGYSNYARKGYAANILTYDDVVAVGPGKEKITTTLGGTGIAVSNTSSYKQEAADFAAWITSAPVQATLYVEHGGQPGDRRAWGSPEANLLCNNFFKNTLVTLDRAYMRPRYNGYLTFQDHAGVPLQHFLQNGGSSKAVLDKMNRIYRETVNLAE